MRECLNCGYWDALPEKLDREYPACGQNLDVPRTLWELLKDIWRYMKEGWDGR